MTRDIPPPEVKRPLQVLVEVRSDTAGTSAEDRLRELQARQIALEKQNEALSQTQAALTASRDRYVDLHELATLGYLSLSATGRINDANTMVASLLGLEREQLLQRRFDQYVGTVDCDYWQQQFTRAMTETGNVTVELSLRRHDGTGIHARLDCLRVMSGDAPPTLRIALIDVTEAREARRQADELKQTSQYLRQLVEVHASELEEARHTVDAVNRAKATLIANLSHEVRTPMNVMLGFAQLLHSSTRDPAQLEKTRKIVAAGDHLLSIVNNLFDMSKLESGKIVLERRNFFLADLMGSLVAAVGDTIRAKGLSLRVDTAGTPDVLCGDAARLGQALLYYLRNAIKLTERGGITLKVRLLSQTDENYRMRFQVIDTSPGLPVDQQTHMFDGLARSDRSGTGERDGIGVGLAITRRIAQLMGGEVGVDSAIGEGSDFWMSVLLGKGGPQET